ncbi:MAG: maltotransferase domain-containing protein, partial [Bacteroidales bacterium]
MSRHSPDERPSRVVIEGVKPEVDGGRFPIKRVIGDAVEVGADIFADGHDRLAGVVRYRVADAPLDAGALGQDRDWHEVPVEHVRNDRWSATFHVRALGRYEYTLQAWVDRFASWRDEVGKKFAASQPVHAELLEGAGLVREAAAHAARTGRADGGVLVKAPPGAPRGPGESSDDARRWLLHQADLLCDVQLPEAERVALAQSPRLAAEMAEHAPRLDATAYDRILQVQVERERARFGAWYEMFPRSAGSDPSRSATFDEAARRLPAGAALGFDVVYLPPVHPIGRSFRKGRNNALTAGPADPGSPWAIGADEGGHTAVDPSLGGLAAFERFVRTARNLGLEI